MKTTKITRTKVPTPPSAAVVSTAELAPRNVIRQEFGKRLTSMMRERNLRQTDIARMSGIPRDSISNYCNGRVLPEPQNAQKLADAFGLKVTEIYPPSFMRHSTEAETPGIRLTQATGEPGRAWLYVNRSVSFRTAAEIITIIEKEDGK